MANRTTAGHRRSDVIRSRTGLHALHRLGAPRLACLALLAGISAAFAQTPSKPNFIFILADDLGWTCLSQPMDDRVANSRSDFHETPSLERLARAGMRFSNGYSPGAICCPTRRAIQFGQTPVRQGDLGFPARYAAGLGQRLTIPRLLKSIDPRYRTAHYGKWDLRADMFPEDLGYDESDGNTGNNHGDISIRTSQADAFTQHYLKNDPKRIDTLTGRALSFIRRNHEAGSPFYLQLSHYATHVDIQTRATTFAKYAAKPKGSIHNDPAWAGMLEDLDGGIGRVLDLVAELGIADHTYVIFMADNGAAEFHPPIPNKMDPPSRLRSPARNHPLRGGKWVTYEGGIRVPFIVSGPGIRPGSQCDVPVTGWDLLPTIADLAGHTGPLPADLDGGTFRELLQRGRGEVKRPEEGLVFHFYAGGDPREAGPARLPRPPHTALRAGDYKLVRIWSWNKTELYNLRDDVGETSDLAASMPRKAEELNAQLMSYLRRVDSEVLWNTELSPALR